MLLLLLVVSRLIAESTLLIAFVSEFFNSCSKETLELLSQDSGIVEDGFSGFVAVSCLFLISFSYSCSSFICSSSVSSM